MVKVTRSRRKTMLATSARKSVRGPHPTEASRFQTRPRRKARLCEIGSGAIVRWKTFPIDTCLPNFHDAGGGGDLGGFSDDSPCHRARRGASSESRRNVRRVGLEPRVREDNARAYAREAHARRSEPTDRPDPEAYGAP